ncbi:hypothetical protein C1I98_17465 [Spongiactinospora gelatinilytica]|uniref:Uncharacterized protein n=1 Tax=Spongiactinospora gelatinilytica TaxID=2666298 RepID=A0A2W2G7C8_9ACTN|nr:hypothetical protein [Spongiactinospora gelatinilytica]PZG44221.1 hypothetical protein C1I98_17465 [Spongiactinospora gelatinilytica]
MDATTRRVPRSSSDALRATAVAASTGPILVRAFVAGPADVTPMLCRVPWAAAMLAGDVGTFLSLIELLVPVSVFALAARASRRTTVTAIVILCAALALRVTTAFVSPPLPANVPLWVPIACYAAAVLALLPHAARPDSSAPWRTGTLFWTLAGLAATWTVVRWLVPLGTPSPFGWFAYTPLSEAPSTGFFAYAPWGSAAWTCKVDADGLSVALIVLGALTTALVRRARWPVALTITTALVVVAVTGRTAPFLTETEPPAAIIHWHLLVAAALVLLAAFRDRR